MKIIKAKPGDFIVAGQQGEELARRVEFDVAEWERLYGPGTVQLLVKRMTDETFYPVAIEQEQGVAIWTVTVPETSVAGKYHTYELRYYAGETLAKAVGGRFSINEAFVGEEGEVPEVHQGWVEQVLEAGANAVSAKNNAEIARALAVKAKEAAEAANAEVQEAREEVAGNAEKAVAAAEEAEKNAIGAKVSEQNAETSANLAINANQEAGASMVNAQIYANSAVDAANMASSSAGKATLAKLDAETSQKKAATSEKNASAYAEAAALSKSRAITSELNANASKEAAARSEEQAKKYAEEAKKAAESAGGGTSVQPDWNQNDPAQPDYVKNRTHYETKEVVEILPECQPAYVEEEGFFQSANAAIVPAVGAACVVNWNGTKYDCVAQDLSAMLPGAVALGNGSMWGLPNADEPFAIVVVEQDGTKACLALPLDGTTELTLSICQEQTAVVPLAGKYLPEGVPYIEGEKVRKLDNRCLDLMWLPTNNYATLIEQKTLSFQHTDSDGRFYDGIDTVDLVDGQRVRVDFDGVQYELAAVADGYGAFLVGNGSILNFGPDTGEPFALVFRPDISAAYATVQKPHTLAMYGLEPNKMPAEFLPDTAATKDDINTAIFGAMEASY